MDIIVGIINFIKDWWFLLAVIGTGILSGMRTWYIKMIKERLDKNETDIKNGLFETNEDLKYQNGNYNLKFDETHKMIKELDNKLSYVQNDVSKISGNLQMLVNFLQK